MAVHVIPDDGLPHAPSTECGCGVQRVWSPERGRHVFEHQDGGDAACSDEPPFEAATAAGTPD